MIQVDPGGERRVFLDVVSSTAQGAEEGLLSIAFPPDHATSGLFYVFQVRADHSALDVVEFRRDPADPNRADPGSRRLVAAIAHTQANNHNGGDLSFGRDGFLYVSTGDGGTQGDPEGDARNPGSELGKILRIDAATGAGAPGNPFGNRVYHRGLRNPYRFAFDRSNGDMLIGDVGAGATEELNLNPAGTGPRDYGWNCFEGNAPTGSCTTTGDTKPALSLSHTDGYRSIIGGVVVRDPQVPSLAGRYLYGDIEKTRLRSVAVSGETATGDRAEDALVVSQPVEFGEDACGRVHVGTIDDGAYTHAPGTVYRLQEAGQASMCVPAPVPTPAPQPGVTPAADTRPCSLRVRAGRTPRRLGTKRPRLRFTVRADEPCTLRFRARAAGQAFRTRTVRVNGATPTPVALSLTRDRLRRLRASLRRGSRLARLTVDGLDAAGNRSRATKRIRLRR